MDKELTGVYADIEFIKCPCICGCEAQIHKHGELCSVCFIQFGRGSDGHGLVSPEDKRLTELKQKLDGVKETANRKIKTET